jgi:hypothetical protein
MMYLSQFFIVHPVPAIWTFHLRACFVFAGLDWITWLIWTTGLIILIVWIIRPIQEFRILIRTKREEMKA